ncbi:MAG: Rpn family recombination-promoting nuclease/putative transposase [Planctomycetes bacterium]|nr:Rpn family recombination-promoting nuclease/putative transposase [Planctomycetota bacterium]
MLIYILVEHESAEKPLFPEGVLAAITRIYAWDRREKLRRGLSESELRLHVVVPILFYTGARSWHPLPTMLDLVACPPAFEGFVPRNDLLVVSLQKTPKEALLEADRFFGAVLRLLQARGAPPEEYRALLGQMVRFLDDLRELDQPRWYRLAGSMLTLSLFFRAPEEHATLEEVVVVNIQNAERAAEVRTMAKTIAESLLEQGWKGGLEEGRAVGRAEGEAVGRAEGKAETLVRLLARRFGRLPAGLADRIRAVRDEARLDAWLDLVLSAQSREEMRLP